MINVIDVSGLTNKDVQIVQSLVDSLREKLQTSVTSNQKPINFGEWSLGVSGTLSRSEIYEDL